jgi:hypothetical protein
VIVLYSRDCSSIRVSSCSCIDHCTPYGYTKTLEMVCYRDRHANSEYALESSFFPADSDNDEEDARRKSHGRASSSSQDSEPNRSGHEADEDILAQSPGKLAAATQRVLRGKGAPRTSQAQQVLIKRSAALDLLGSEVFNGRSWLWLLITLEGPTLVKHPSCLSAV